MLRFLIEKVYGRITGALFHVRKSIALEVAAYMCLYKYLTNKELDACIDNYSETIEIFKKDRDDEAGYDDYYNPVIKALENMLFVFILEKGRRAKV